MSARRCPCALAGLLLAVSVFLGCESTDGGSSGSTTVYYGATFYDPWYHGDYDYDHDHNVTITPPPINRPGGGGDRWESRPRPEHPIARPPGESYDRPSTRPAPSIPSTPRVSPRSGGGGGRRR